MLLGYGDASTRLMNDREATAMHELLAATTRSTYADDRPLRPLITAASWGWCYLFHFSRPLGNLSNPRAQAQHYTGWAADPDGDGTELAHRIAEHLAGQGARITRAAVAQGIELTIVATWRAPLAFEKTLKRRKDGPNICPVCCRERGRRAKQLACGLEQLALPLLDPVEPWPEGFDFPSPPAIQADWYEASYYRRQRAARLVPVLADNWDDGLF